ncbi:hypothetical protein DHEL01_v213136 [Diaporthe helianthi]|uniref:Uncharacterized protein n=1 Tax=Diaporthe helianthi TaxID=158607 RepID=A0A2P5HE10_DIAHE|nr:hypothetical protein DHEL01_v213136 [Diaporthe helianthi]
MLIHGHGYTRSAVESTLAKMTLVQCIIQEDGVAMRRPEPLACVLMSASRLVGGLGSEFLASNLARQQQILFWPGDKKFLARPLRPAQDVKACTAEKLAKARESIGDARIFGWSWPLNESIMNTDTPSDNKGCALDSARGSGVHVGRRPDPIWVYWDAACSGQMPRRD